MVKILGTIQQYPARISLLSYLSLIAVGSILLCLPFAVAAGKERLTLTDAVFTATSALCVTGLSVRDTGGDLSFFGQSVVLLLIQIGGVGIVTLTTFFTFHMGLADLRQREAARETLGPLPKQNLRHLLGSVLVATALVEAAGFFILFLRNVFQKPPLTALWHALFHSISAYCNAGFSLNADSFESYQGDWIVNLTLSALIITGGIGFPVILDLARTQRLGFPGVWQSLHLHSKLMLAGTTALLLLGTIAFLAIEFDGVLAEMHWSKKVLVSFFNSVTCRTAGFNTVEVASLTNASLFLMMLLMIVGAGPCSTGGGMKVSTFLVIALRGLATARGDERVTILRRTIPRLAVDRATTTALVFGVIAIVAVTSMLIVEQSDKPHELEKGAFLDSTFEVVSALGTAGLSVGATNDTSTLGRWILILLMFLGRLGPISVAIAVSRRARKRPYEYAESEPLIG